MINEENKEKMPVLKHFNPMKLREKYSANSPKTSNSSFWMGDDFGRRTSIFDSWGEEEVKKPKVDTIALASYRRSISNFVNIVTGRNDIRVTFKSGEDSYTDGKKVVISSNIKEKNFDSTVGLALHEGSHILLSDFEFLRNLTGGFVTDNETILKAEKKGYDKTSVLSHLKMLLNYVEDRRIDYHIFKNSPGYKGYYHSMYKSYFHSNVIDKALKSDEYTSNDWNSYIFRIINLTNENRNLNAVTDLDKIYKLLFVENHPSTIKDTKSAFKIAVSIYHIILDNLEDGVEETDEFGEVSSKPASESKDGETGESGNGGGDTEGKKELSDEEFEGLKKAVEGGEVGRGHSSGSDIVLSEAQKKQLERAFDKQKDFVNGKTKKTKLAKKYASEISAVEESGMKLTDVGAKNLGEYEWRTDSYNNGMTKCVVIDRITDGLLENDLCEVLTNYSYHAKYSDNTVAEGLRLGTMLGKKLKVRNESRDTKWTRKDSGRIDKRLIAELGFGNERVFSSVFTDSYADAHLHISIDASGSMSGDKWTNTIKATVAICKAASMIEGLTVEVSVRYTTYNRQSRRSEEMPAILMAYDSRKNKIAHIKKYFKYLRTSGTTPEGLCYQAIMDKISSGSNEKESYFLNFSDGMPMFSNGNIRYYHDEALNHTKKMVKEIRGKGVKVLSYYIGGEYERQSNMVDFKKMYGKDAKFIDVTSVGAVAKTMNKKFLSK
jgi:hypothetical protein